MNGVNEPEENGKISNLLNLDAEKQTFGRKSQNWLNLMDKNSILLYFFLNTYSSEWECENTTNGSES
ncbi:hypothetical protein Hanom_Chr13g01228151 [Helianthus anomalus]